MSELSNDQLKSLLGATARGDAASFKTMYDLTSPKMHAVALTILRDPDLAEDALQDAFVQVWHRASEFHAERGSVLTWMTTLVRYRAIDLLRRRGHGGASGNNPDINVDSAAIDFLKQSATGADEQPQSGPLACAISGEENSMLRDCIERLSINQQRSVTLAFFRGFTHQELADCLAEPLGTIKSRLRRSLVRLKECLENLGDSDEIRRGAS